jgi:TonB family protein
MNETKSPCVTQWRALFLVALCAASSAARADLHSASQAYAKKDFVAAFNEFRALAELGQPLAQHFLAVMYARGEGVALSNTNAHAWASLAVQRGETGAQEIVNLVEPQLTPTSLRLSKEIQEQYSPAKLSEHLMPKFLVNREFVDREPVRRDKTFIPQYPIDAQRQGIQGQVYIEFVVAADGRARMPRILFALPQKVFDSAARESVLRTSFVPARLNGAPVSSMSATYINFQMRDVSKDDYPDLLRFVKRTQTQAEAGDTNAQVTYAMLISGLPQVQKPFSEALPWFFKAAQSGNAYSQYQVGTALLQGRGCLCEETKGEIWLERAAQSDQPDAQVTLAEYLLKGTPSPESIASARIWLDRAVKSGHKNAKLYQAAFMATSPDAENRDPAMALKLISDVFPDFKDDPTTWEIRAASLAAEGQYPKAVKDQNAAIERATTLGWDLHPLQDRLASYLANRPWSGNLLSF